MAKRFKGWVWRVGWLLSGAAFVLAFAGWVVSGGSRSTVTWGACSAGARPMLADKPTWRLHLEDGQVTFRQEERYQPALDATLSLIATYRRSIKFHEEWLAEMKEGDKSAPKNSKPLSPAYDDPFIFNPRRDVVGAPGRLPLTEDVKRAKQVAEQEAYLSRTRLALSKDELMLRESRKVSWKWESVRKSWVSGLEEVWKSPVKVLVGEWPTEGFIGSFDFQVSLVPFVVGSAILTMTAWRFGRGWPVGCCRKCGYDLRGSVGRCSECGGEIGG